MASYPPGKCEEIKRCPRVTGPASRSHSPCSFLLSRSVRYFSRTCRKSAGFSGPLRALWPCLVLLLLLIIAIVVNRWRRNRRNREEEVEEGSTEDAEPLADEV